MNLYSWYQMWWECRCLMFLRGDCLAESHAAMHIWVRYMHPKAILLPAVKGAAHYLDFGGFLTLVPDTHHEAQRGNRNKINGSVAMDTERDPSFWPWWYSFTFLNLLHISHGTDCGKIPSVGLPCDTVLASVLLFLRNRLCTAGCLRAFLLIRGVVMYVFFTIPPPISTKHKQGYYRSV